VDTGYFSLYPGSPVTCGGYPGKFFYFDTGSGLGTYHNRDSKLSTAGYKWIISKNI
jgi:hypothetical protein